MEMIPIPKTGLTVSPICLGTMTFGTPVSEADAISLTHWALDNGVNFIDTANMYEGYARVNGSSGGVAEEILGKALKGRRKSAVLATKVGMKVGDNPEDAGTNPAAIRTQLERSLKRLATDYVDIYYLHRPDPDVPLADILGTLSEAISQGKIKYYGISNYDAARTAKLLKAADENNLPRPVIHQPPYSLLKPEAELELLPLCEREQIAAAPYQVLQGGLLTGKYHRGEEAPGMSRLAEKPGWMPDLTEKIFDRLESLQSEAEKKGLSLLQYTLRETLAKPAVISLILGVKRIGQLKSLLKALS